MSQAKPITRLMITTVAALCAAGTVTAADAVPSLESAKYIEAGASMDATITGKTITFHLDKPGEFDFVPVFSETVTATFAGQGKTGSNQRFEEVSAPDQCNTYDLVVAKGSETVTYKVAVSAGDTFPRCLPPNTLEFTGLTVARTGEPDYSAPDPGAGWIPFSGITALAWLHAPAHVEITYDGSTSNPMLVALDHDKTCSQFDFVLTNSYGQSKTVPILLLNLNRGLSPCYAGINDSDNGDGGSGSTGGSGSSQPTQTTTPNTPSTPSTPSTPGPSRSGGGGGFFIPPSFFGTPTQSEPEPEPLPFHNGTLYIRMAHQPMEDGIGSGISLTPFQCNVTDTGNIHIGNLTDSGIEWYTGNATGLDISTGNSTIYPLDHATQTNHTATYNMTLNTLAKFNVTQLPKFDTLLDMETPDGLVWKGIFASSLATFQEIYGTVTVLYVYQYGTMDWRVQGGMCWVPEG